MKLNIQLFAVSKSTKFSESNISVENNTSSLKISIEFSANNSTTYFSNETLYCTCNGTTKSKKVSHSKGGKVSTSFTFDNIAHNSDGSKSVSWSWNCNTGTSVLGNISASGTKALTKIARASAVSTQYSTEYIGRYININITEYIENVSHILKYNFNGVEGYISYSQITSSPYVWTLDNDLAEDIPNSTSGICTIICETYDENNNYIGSTSTDITLELFDSVKPSVSIGTLTEADTTMQSLNWGVFVQNKSKLNIPITATGIYGSTIQSIVTTINGLSFTGTPVTTSTLVTAGTNTISTTATDSRGRTETTTKTYNVVAYANPVIQVAQVQRCLSDGTLSDNGTYVLIDYKASISSVNNNNSKIHKIGYKKTTDLTYTYVTLSNNYDVDIQDQVSSFTISSDYAYDIIFEATDSFMTASIERTLDTGFDLLNFNASGKAMAIGKVSEAGANEELLEIGLPTEFLEDIETQDITAVDITCGDVSASGDITSASITSTDGTFDTITYNSADLADYFFYKANDEIILGDTTSDYYVMNGYITSSKTKLFVTIHTAKRLDNITSVAVNNLNVEARGISGYLNSLTGFNEYVGLTGFTITASISGSNAITIEVEKTNGEFVNVTNNTPIVLDGYVKLTLS